MYSNDCVCRITVHRVPVHTFAVRTTTVELLSGCGGIPFPLIDSLPHDETIQEVEEGQRFHATPTGYSKASIIPPTTSRGTSIHLTTCKTWPGWTLDLSLTTVRAEYPAVIFLIAQQPPLAQLSKSHQPQPIRARTDGRHGEFALSTTR